VIANILWTAEHSDEAVGKQRGGKIKFSTNEYGQKTTINP